MSSTARRDGLSLRQAPRIAGFGYLLGLVTYAECSIYPKLIATNINPSVQNSAANHGPFAAGNPLSARRIHRRHSWRVPVNRAVSLPSGWFRLIQAAANEA